MEKLKVVLMAGLFWTFIIWFARTMKRKSKEQYKKQEERMPEMESVTEEERCYICEKLVDYTEAKNVFWWIMIFLNLFFVIVCHMDVAGVALASIISQYVSAALILQALLRCKDIYALHPGKLRLDPELTKDILKLGMPSGLQNVIFQFANSFVQMGVNSFDATMVAGNSAATNADAMVYDVMAAFYTACGSFMGQNYGAGKKKRVRNSYLISLAYSFGIGMILGVSLVFFGRAFLSLFTRDAAVMNAGMYRLTIMGFSYCISAFMDCTIAAARAMGKSIIPMFIVIMGSCVFRVIWVYTVFAYFHTIPSLYLLYVFSWSITAVAEILYFIRIY